MSNAAAAVVEPILNTSKSKIRSPHCVKFPSQDQLSQEQDQLTPPPPPPRLSVHQPTPPPPPPPPPYSCTLVVSSPSAQMHDHQVSDQVIDHEVEDRDYLQTDYNRDDLHLDYLKGRGSLDSTEVIHPTTTTTANQMRNILPPPSSKSSSRHHSPRAPPPPPLSPTREGLISPSSLFPSSWSMPFTLDNWRWGLQEALTIAILMWPCCVPSVDKMLFNGNSRWVVANATPVIEGTAGGTTRRMIDRVIGTLIAGLWVIVSISCTVGVKSEKSDRWYCLVPLYLVISLSGFIWNWLLYILPTHPLIGITATFMTPIIISGSVFTGSGVVYASWRSITVSLGVIVSGIISRYFLPRRARVDIIMGLADIMTHLAQTLDPLVKVESGLVSDHRFQAQTGEVEISMTEWYNFKHAVWKKLEICGKLTNDQLVMVKAARTEISLRKKNAFFEDEHLEALVNIRTLFYHVASLFFLIETQIIGSTKSDFDDQDLEEEVQHWSRFTIQGKGHRKGRDEGGGGGAAEGEEGGEGGGGGGGTGGEDMLNESGVDGGGGGGSGGEGGGGGFQGLRSTSRSREMNPADIINQNLNQRTSADERVKLLITGNEDPFDMGTLISFEDITPGRVRIATTEPAAASAQSSSLSGNVRSDVSEIRTSSYNKESTSSHPAPPTSSSSSSLPTPTSRGVRVMTPSPGSGGSKRADPTRHWLRTYGPTISLMVKHICRALTAAAEGLRDNTFPIEAELSMKKAADAIALFHRQRAERQQATATFVEYAVHGRNSHRVAEDDPTFISRFEGMLGLTIAEYEQLSENGRTAFWQSYWLFRDRLSTTDTNIMTLFVAVRTAIAAVERLIQVRRAKISRGEDLNDQVDIEKLEAQQQEAVNKAGAAVAGYRGPQWHRTKTTALLKGAGASIKGGNG